MVSLESIWLADSRPGRESAAAVLVDSPEGCMVGSFIKTAAVEPLVSHRPVHYDAFTRYKHRRSITMNPAEAGR